MATPSWAPISRNYENEKVKCALKSSSAVSHPLLPNRPKEVIVSSATPPRSSSPTPTGVSKLTKTNSVTLDPLSDPLSSFADPLSGGSNTSSAPIFDPLLNTAPSHVHIDDPLSGGGGFKPKAVESRSQNIEVSRQTAKAIHEDNLNTPWQNRKAQILKDYAIVGNITLNSAAINEFAGSGVEDGSATRHLDKYNARLASLEKRQVNEVEKVELTQAEYANHVKKLTRDLQQAWANDERVGSLKIAIQIAKLLADTTLPQFYPSIFVMVTESLDKFGEMVFQRLKNRSEEAFAEQNRQGKRGPTKLNDNFTSADVPAIAKEICRNWFYKIACIRELLPRIYIEVALFRCYRFLTDTDYLPILSRLGSIIRGVGDPLVSLYLRTYLVVICGQTVPHLTTFSQSMLQDVVVTLSVIQEPYMIKELAKSNISTNVYYHLLSPGVEWIVRTVGRSASRDVFQSMLQLYREHSNDAMMLKHFIDFFDGTFYSHAALGMATLIKSSYPSSVGHVDLYTSLGKQLSTHPPPEEQRLPLLNEVWKVVSKSTDILGYVRCSYAWLDLVQKYYSEREMFVLLGNLAARLEETYSLESRVEVPEPVLQTLEALISSLIGQSSTFGTAVLTSEHLLKILDFFRGIRKVVLCKDIIESFKNLPSTNDAVLINTLFDLCRIIHDSVDCLSPHTEIAHIAALLNSFIDKINFGKDLEQQLNFYVDCRGAFCNIDLIKDKLIANVGNLAMRAYKIMKGKHSKKTATFVKACLAYCHITIPSLTDAFRKLELLLQCAQISLVNTCLPQTDTFLKAAITILPEMPTHYEVDGKRVHYEERLASYLCCLLATLVVTPGHPDHGPFYIIQGLVNAVPRFAWQPSTGVQTRVYTNMLALLCTLAQKKFPYHINGVQSNDELYGGAPSYMTELSEHVDTCIAEILKQLTALGERAESAAKLAQTRTALDLVNQLAARVDMTPSVASFVYKLLELAHKHRTLFVRTDSAYFANTVAFVMVRAQKASAVAAVSVSGSSVNNNNTALSAHAVEEMIASLKVLMV